ncbi:MAG: ABC transporter permease [Alphaproteobacteria bacterium]|nr:ABC transporter permease [Alphaproteobacteria bacterium]
MGRTLNQIAAVTMMNLRSIPGRLWISLSTVVAVALVTSVLLAFLAMANGFQSTVQGTGAADVAVMLRKGSGSELNSTISREQALLLEDAPGIARGADGKALVSPELYVVVDGIKKSSRTKANLPLRGLSARADQVRRGVKVSAGRMFRSGTNELVVGRAVSRQFEGFELGRTIKLASQKWTVVGEFEAGGSVFESEIWADVALLQGLYQRGSTVQTVRARLRDPTSLAELKKFSESDPRLKLDVQAENAYYAEQGKGMSDIILYLGWPLAIAMSLGALAGALNTMYASVDARMREIATLRAIGFGGAPAFVGTMAESLLLSVIGGVVGAIATFLLFDGISAATLGSNFTQVVFSLKLTPALVLQGVILSLVIGFAGGVFPAWRAARAPLLAAFKER